MGGKIKRYHIGKNAVQGDTHIKAGTIPYSKLEDDTILLEIAIPIVVDKQSVTSSTLATLDGYCKWDPDAWTAALIKKIYVELEYESAGAGDVDLYNLSDGSKLADLVAPSAATSHTITRVDVTTEVKALTAAKNLAIQAAGDGTNALDVYSAKLIVQIGIS